MVVGEGPLSVGPSYSMREEDEGRMESQELNDQSNLGADCLHPLPPSAPPTALDSFSKENCDIIHLL